MAFEAVDRSSKMTMQWPIQSAVSALQNIAQAIGSARTAVQGIFPLLWKALSEQAVVFSSTIVLDLSTGFNFGVTLTGNSVLENPINAKAGQTGSIYLTQDATGSRTVTFGTAWYWAGGVAPTLSTTANAVDVINYKVRSPTVVIGQILKAISP